MLCPVCRQAMVIVEFEEIELDACPDCRGIWFDAQELRELFEVLEVAPPQGDWQHALDRLPGTRGRRLCPRCRGRLQVIQVPDTGTAGGDQPLTLDRCPRGHGLWFDRGELPQLVRGAAGRRRESLEVLKQYLGQFAESHHPDRPG